jgi:hypothetical protein
MLVVRITGVRMVVVVVRMVVVVVRMVVVVVVVCIVVGLMMLYLMVGVELQMIYSIVYILQYLQGVHYGP